MSGDTGVRRRGRRIALLLEYDGTEYCGSQYQENGPSIQGELESAINNLTAERVRAAFAGRTDAGVHALGQVAAFDTDSAIPLESIVSGLNHFLPEDVAVKRAAEVDAELDPRRDAKNRVYAYRIDNRPLRSPLLRNRVWHVDRPLDVAAMQPAANHLIGVQHFAAFAAPFDGRTERTLRRCEIMGSCEQLTLRMEAQAFLPHQVRRTVGPLVEVGLGRMTEDDLVALLNAAKPSTAGPAAPPCGLYLAHIEYDGLDFGPEA